MEEKGGKKRREDGTGRGERKEAFVISLSSPPRLQHSSCEERERKGLSPQGGDREFSHSPGGGV
jgi:hypothetical protein